MADEDISTLLRLWGHGDQQALHRLIPLVYFELRRLAARELRREHQGQSLQSAALVHEAYLKLLGESGLQLQNRGHFFALAAQLMRRILVDRARSRRRLKRGGGVAAVPMDAIDLAVRKDAETIALDDALTALAKLDARQSQIVELRYFAGLTIEETAEALGISKATANRDWLTARAWLLREIGPH